MEYKLNTLTYVVILIFSFIFIQIPFGGLLPVILLILENEKIFSILIVIILCLVCFIFGIYLLKVFIDITKSNCSSIIVYTQTIVLKHKIKGKIELHYNNIKNIEVKGGAIVGVRGGGRIKIGKIKIETMNNEIYSLYISDYYDFYFKLPQKIKSKLKDTPIFDIKK